MRSLVVGTSRLVFVLAFAVCTLALAPPPASAGRAAHAAELGSGATLKRIAVIDLPGPPGRRFDYLAIDDHDRYLFSAHLAAGLLYVIDLRTSTVVKTIPDVPGIEGVAYVPELRKVYTTDFWEKKIGVIDLREMRVVKKIPTEDKPDGITYAPPFHKAYVSNGRGKAGSVIDARAEQAR